VSGQLWGAHCPFPAASCLPVHEYHHPGPEELSLDQQSQVGEAPTASTTVRRRERSPRTACRSANRRRPPMASDDVVSPIMGAAPRSRHSASPATVRRRSPPRAMAASEPSPCASHQCVSVGSRRDEQLRVYQPVLWMARMSTLGLCSRSPDRMWVHRCRWRQDPRRNRVSLGTRIGIAR
jgi:hypothetical protein